MSASQPGPTRRFFRGLWRFIDASRRVVLNLVFLAVLLLIVVALVKTGPGPIADKTALVLRLDGTIAEQKTGTLRSSALDQVRGETVQKILLRDVLAVLDTAAADPKITSLVVILDEMRPTGFLDPARDRRRRRPLQGERQEGRRLGLVVRPAPVLHRGARRRGLPASARHGLPLRLRRLAQLLPRRARQARRDRQPDARRHLQERGRALHRQRALRRRAPGRKLSLRRPLEDLLDAVEKERKLPAGAIMRGIDEAPQRLAAAGGAAPSWRWRQSSSTA